MDLDETTHALAECYRLSGADPDGDEDWRLAPHAVSEVTRLRNDYDEACEREVKYEKELATAFIRITELEAALIAEREAREWAEIELDELRRSIEFYDATTSDY